MKTREQIILLILASIQFTHIMDFMIVMPLGPKLMRLFDISASEYGMIVSGYAIAAGLSGFLAAFFIDRFDRKKALMTAYLLFIVGTFACSMSTGFTQLLLSRMFTGAFGGMLSSLLISIVADIYPYERRAAAMGTVMMAFSIAAVAGVPFGLHLSDTFSWEAPFIFLGIISSLIFVFIVIYVPALKQHIGMKVSAWKEIMNVKALISDTNHLRALLVILLLMFGQFTVIPYISTYMVANTGYLETELSYIYIIGGGASMLTMPIIGKLSDKYGKRRMFTILILLSVIPIYFLTNLTKVPCWLALSITTLFFVVIGGRSIPAFTMISAASEKENRGSFMSLTTAVRQLSIGGASFLAGHVLLQGKSGMLSNYDIIGWVAIVASLLSLYLARSIKIRS